MHSKKTQIVTIDPQYAGQRIDNYLIARLKGIPKSRIYRIIRKGEVRVNKGRIKPLYHLKPGDQIRIPPVMVNEPKHSAPSQSLQKLIEQHILMEDDDLLIINKPSGLAVHGGSTLTHDLMQVVSMLRPHNIFLRLAHRLDKGTSGCVVIAKNLNALRELQILFKTRKIKKTYLALTKGHWEKEHTKIETYMQKNILQSGERRSVVTDEGKAASTEFYVKKRYKIADFVRVLPHTGRTHQIRIHSEYAQHPIAGDSKYGDHEFNRLMKSVHLHRLFLHAERLQFTWRKREINVYAPLNEDLMSVLQQLDRL
ncbi:MAG: RluA family pseudouridine synthase [Pseudomonadota bacterium]